MGRLWAPNVVLARSIAYGLTGGPTWFLERIVHNLHPRYRAMSSAFTPAGGIREREAFIDAVVDSAANRGR